MRTGRRLRTAATGALTGLAVIASLLVAGAPAQAAGPVLDGSTAALAAPSCWSIKQSVPASVDGIYWLQTAKLETAQQFYCDMTTDGGGWVLVGRGRDGWSWTPKGQGSGASAVRTTPTGTAAFAPATLPSVTIDGLLNGASPSTLADGIRVRRATNNAGTTWQELRLFEPSSVPTWNWTIGGGIPLNNVRADGTLYSGGNTQNWGADSQYKRLSTAFLTSHNNRMGWGFGSQVKASNTTTNYLWSYTNEGNALPFTQVWVRPQITDGGFTTIPDSGTAASTQRAMISDSTVNSTPWGVTGVVGGFQGELTLEVEAFAFIGNVTYVGGFFQYVQKGATPGPGEQVEQHYLAAFNTTTGEWISTFRPVLDGAVWDLAVSPDGKLIVGGEFTNANGASMTQGLAMLDPVTGATDPTWRANVQYVQTTGTLPAQVKAMDIQDGYLYIGGRFNRVQGGGGPLITLGRASRISLATAKPDGAWKPNFDGTIVELDASADRVTMSGYFQNVNATPQPYVAAVTTATGGALIPGQVQFTPSIGTATGKGYQQAVKDLGDSVWLGGSQHSLSKLSRTDMSRIRSTITNGGGGDIQAITAVNGIVYASCHCGAFAYSDTYTWSPAATMISQASRVDVIQYVGAWDQATGAFLGPQFLPSLDSTHGIGVFALEVDPQGCLWAGGDLKQGSWTGTQNQWLGGFAKFCPRDSTAPTTPTNLAFTRSGGNVKLTWGAATDASAIQYQVLRDDRVVATLSGSSLSYTTPDTGVTNKYFVRAIDAAGNEGASTPALLVSAGDLVPPTAPGTPTLASATASSITLQWAASTDNQAVAGYRVFRNGVQVGGNITTGTSYTDSGLTPSTSYSYTVVAYDTSNLVSPSSGAASLSTTADTAAPTAPTGVGAANVTQTSLTVGWNASTDNVGVAGYRVLRDGTQVSGNITAGTSFNDSGLTAGTTYSYTVVAYDAAGNVSAASSPALSVTTSSGNVQPLYSDTFTGADGTAWNASWQTSNASGSATIVGNAGSLAYTDVAGAYSRALLNVPAVADSDVTFTYAWSSTAAKSYVDIGMRGSGGWQNAYRMKTGYYLELSSSSGTVSVGRSVAGTVTSLGSVSGANALTTGKQNIRIQVTGSTVRFRIWAFGTSEPAAWSFSVTDTAVTTAGQFSISEVRASTNVGDKAISLDDLVMMPA
ncbi:MAG TPA: fibrinogen-like YCDxxxxGGGW domain-containing protein [Candidatus Nanopelagicales bacterium]|nr:fibrinogen-like YCDxxxxGGGW domain-containing protein [Candidatus Nanopelagicales bacterium]